jgi:hypothetical protein
VRCTERVDRERAAGSHQEREPRREQKRCGEGRGVLDRDLHLLGQVDGSELGERSKEHQAGGDLEARRNDRRREPDEGDTGRQENGGDVQPELETDLALRQLSALLFGLRGPRS